jgi:addiction module HigA family antidote
MTAFAPTHAGEILLTEFLEPMGISQYRIARVIDVPPRRINEIVHGSEESVPTPRCVCRAH